MSDDGRPRLIFDIGASGGNDTAFYLAKGFNVIAVEADPIAYDALCSRFREFIDQGRLIVCNRAAAECPGEQVSFLHNPNEQGISSLRSADRIAQGIEYQVQTITWPELVGMRGVPYYAKVDIEGSEPPFLKSIPATGDLPKFFSVECSTPQPIKLLSHLGYKNFRLMNQLLVNQFAPPDPPKEGKFVSITGLQHWSGLFGNELPGNRWFNYSEIMDVYERLHSLWLLQTLTCGWLDVHACLDEDQLKITSLSRNGRTQERTAGVNMTSGAIPPTPVSMDKRSAVLPLAQRLGIDATIGSWQADVPEVLRECAEGVPKLHNTDEETRLMSTPASNLSTQPYWEQVAGGSEIFALALQSSTADANERDKALPLAEECLKRLLNQDPVSGRFHVHLLPRSEIGVADAAQIVVAIDGQDRHLYVPADLIGPVFPYFLDRFQVLRMFCSTDPMRVVSEGHAVWDFNDGSSTGNYPSISFCSNLANAYLISDLQFLYHKGYQQLRNDIQSQWIPWHERKPKVFWRGSTTGMRRYTPKRKRSINDWRWLQRLHLCDVAARSPHRNVLDVGVAIGGEGGLPSIPEKYLRDAIDQAGFSRPRCEKLDFLGYRYLIDIDGYANSWNGLFSAMLMGATIFKIASPFGYRQWFYDKLVAWENYIPVSADLSDLDDHIEWALSHTDQCAAMGRSIAALASELTYETQLDYSAEIVRDAFTIPASGVFSGILQSLAKRHETTRNIPRDKTIYLMTAHGTFVGIDDKSTLVQLNASEATLPMLVPFEIKDDGNIRNSSILSEFQIETSSKEVSFTKNGKYLCALYHAPTFVADRDIRGPWEIFAPVAHDMMVHFMGRQLAPRDGTKLEGQDATVANWQPQSSAPRNIRGDKMQGDQTTGPGEPKLTEEQRAILQNTRALYSLVRQGMGRR